MHTDNPGSPDKSAAEPDAAIADLASDQAELETLTQEALDAHAALLADKRKYDDSRAVYDAACARLLAHRQQQEAA